tara:strand:+ start:1421 stop:2152 length:732 start_codon:yes stop_codon:yes gene_type:complete
MTKLNFANRRTKKENDVTQELEKLLQKNNSSEILKSPFNYLPRQTVTSMLTRIDLFRMIENINGSIVECGTHRCNSTFLYYHLSSIIEPYNYNRKIIGFDTFEGIKNLSKKDQKKGLNKFSDSNYDLYLKLAKIHDKNRSVSHIEKMELIKGDAKKTIPKYIKQNPQLIIALLYLDFSSYVPTKIALKHLLPLVPKGGIVCADKLNCSDWQGETIAFKEEIKLNKVKLKKFKYDTWVSYFVVE